MTTPRRPPGLDDREAYTRLRKFFDNAATVLLVLGFALIPLAVGLVGLTWFIGFVCARLGAAADEILGEMK